MLAYVISSVALGVASLIIFLYYSKQGQFEDVEDVKFQIFRDDENQLK